MRLNKGLEAIVLFVQGALAGLTLASIYMMALAENLESFVGAYEVCKGPSSYLPDLISPRMMDAHRLLYLFRGLLEISPEQSLCQPLNI